MRYEFLELRNLVRPSNRNLFYFGRSADIPRLQYGDPIPLPLGVRLMSQRFRGGLVFVAFCLTLAAALPLLSRGDGAPLGDKYALLVGVRRYDKTELRDLPYAEADMQA